MSLAQSLHQNENGDVVILVICVDDIIIKGSEAGANSKVKSN
jgi:hypothetical protein